MLTGFEPEDIARGVLEIAACSEEARAPWRDACRVKARLFDIETTRHGDRANSTTELLARKSRRQLDMSARRRRQRRGVCQRTLAFDYERLVSSPSLSSSPAAPSASSSRRPTTSPRFVAMPLWFFGGFSIHRSFLVFGFLILSCSTSLGFLALVPYWDNADSSLYQYQSAYLVLTGLFYALYMGNRTNARVETCA